MNAEEKAKTICQFCCSWDGREVRWTSVSTLLGFSGENITRTVRLCRRCEKLFPGQIWGALSSDELIAKGLRMVEAGEGGSLCVDG